MGWTRELVMVASREFLTGAIIELLKRMGFREQERVLKRGEWGIDIVAIRDDPISGTEKLVMLIHSKGLATSKDVNVFADVIDKHKADRGILVSPAGFTKDARLLISREYRGRIVPWDGDRLAVLFQNYGIEPTEELVERAKELQREMARKKGLTSIELDAPLLFDFSTDVLKKKVLSHVTSHYPVKEEEIEILHLKLLLSSAYIVSWSVGDQKDRAVVFSKDEIILKSSSDEKLKSAVRKAMLNDSSIVVATEKETEVVLSPSEAVLFFKGKASQELGVPELKIKVLDRRKVYIPKEAYVELEVGDNKGEARVDLRSWKVEFSLEPLPDDYFLNAARELVEGRVGEKIEFMEVQTDGWKLKVIGKTRRFDFEVSFNKFTGRLLGTDVLMNEDAIEELLKKAYPRGKIIGMERGRKVLVADIETSKGIAVVEVELTKAEYREVRKLVPPKKAFREIKPLIEDNFPVKRLKLKSYSVKDHKFIELEAESKDGIVKVKVDGLSGDVLDYFVEITRERAHELLKERYGELKIVEVEEGEVEYIFTVDDEEHHVKLLISKDGRLIREIDRVLKREVVEKIAEKLIKEIEDDASIKSISLNENWEVEFSGSKYVGVIVLDRASGELLEKKVRHTEMAIKERFMEHVREKYGEKELQIERLTHYEEEGYIVIKLAGAKNYYYGKIDTKSGKILSEDYVPIKGIGSKIKRMQLEGKYR